LRLETELPFETYQRCPFGGFVFCLFLAPAFFYCVREGRKRPRLATESIDFGQINVPILLQLEYHVTGNKEDSNSGFP
jgi:hypothetical protein